MGAKGADAQLETQCASSTASRVSRPSCAISWTAERRRGLGSASGATYSRSRPGTGRALKASSVSRLVAAGCNDERKAARTPRRRSAAHWSAMSAMSGEMTSTTPGRRRAGSW
eukprot:scaffold12265_cov116-Isochrysis_galbana.AAC.6